MKLRLKGNTVRMRLDRRDLERLIEHGEVSDSIQFGPGAVFRYAMIVGPSAPECPTAVYACDTMAVIINAIDVREWNATDRVGFEYEHAVDGGGTVRVLIEKDFACIDRPASEADDDAFAFPNPATAC